MRQLLSPLRAVAGEVASRDWARAAPKRLSFGAASSRLVHHDAFCDLFLQTRCMALPKRAVLLDNVVRVSVHACMPCA